MPFNLTDLRANFDIILVIVGALLAYAILRRNTRLRVLKGGI